MVTHLFNKRFLDACYFPGPAPSAKDKEEKNALSCPQNAPGPVTERCRSALLQFWFWDRQRPRHRGQGLELCLSTYKRSKEVSRGFPERSTLRPTTASHRSQLPWSHQCPVSRTRALSELMSAGQTGPMAQEQIRTGRRMEEGRRGR